MTMAALPVVEPFAVVDTFASDLGRVDHVGDGNMRAMFVVNQQTDYGDSSVTERVVVFKLVASDKAMKRIAYAILAKLAMGHSEAVDEETIALRLNGATVQ
jgi:hypothetical protein